MRAPRTARAMSSSVTTSVSPSLHSTTVSPGRVGKPGLSQLHGGLVAQGAVSTAVGVVLGRLRGDVRPRPVPRALQV